LPELVCAQHGRPQRRRSSTWQSASSDSRESDVPTSAARSPVKPGGGGSLRVGSSLRTFVAPFLRDDDDVAPRDSQHFSQQHSQQHSQEEKFCGGFLCPDLPDNPIMSRDALTEPFHSQGCDQGL
jgi:hypothetical protein